MGVEVPGRSCLVGCCMGRSLSKHLHLNSVGARDAHSCVRVWEHTHVLGGQHQLGLCARPLSTHCTVTRVIGTGLLGPCPPWCVNWAPFALVRGLDTLMGSCWGSEAILRLTVVAVGGSHCLPQVASLPGHGPCQPGSPGAPVHWPWQQRCSGPHAHC